MPLRYDEGLIYTILEEPLFEFRPIPKLQMIEQRKVLVNITATVLQVACVGGIQFLLYRFILKELGVEQLGLWSVILASTLFFNNMLGLTGSVVKFVAKYLALGDEKAVSGVIQTATVSLGVLVPLLMGLAYPALKFILFRVIPANQYSTA